MFKIRKVVWKHSLRKSEKFIPLNISNDVFSVPVLEQDKMKKRAPLQKFVGLVTKADDEFFFTNESFDQNLNEFLDNDIEKRMGNISQIKDESEVGKTEGDEHQPEVNPELKTRINNNIINNLGFLAVLAAQHQQNEQPLIYGRSNVHIEAPISTTQTPKKLSKSSTSVIFLFFL